MTTDKEQTAKRAFRDLMRRIEPRRYRVKGILGFPGNDTDASVSDRPDHVYFQEDGNPSKVSQIFNNKVSPIPGLPVIVGRNATNPTTTQVLDIDIAALPEWLGRSFLQAHHKTHELGSVDSAGKAIDNDIVFVQKGQEVPLALRPDSPASLRMYVFPDYYQHEGDMKYFDGGYTDYFIPCPISGMSYYVSIAVSGAANALNYITGSAFPITGSGTPWRDEIPDALLGTYPLGAVRMGYGATTLGYDETIFTKPYHNTLSDCSVFGIDPMGFENRTDSAISFTDFTRTFAITGTYTFWYQGNRIVGTGDSNVLPPITDMYYFYYDAAGVLQRTLVDWDFFTQTVVAYVYWNNTITDGVLFEERHGISMDVATHCYLHTTRGAVTVEGFDISGYTLSPPAPVDADNAYAISTGVIADEDIETTLAALADGGPYTVWYRTDVTGEWEWIDGDPVPFEWAAGSYIMYNQWTGVIWTLTALGANQYVNYYLIATNAVTTGHQYVLIPGQIVYSNLDAALLETVADLSFDDFPILESAPLYKITYRTSAAYGTTGKCRTEVITRLIGTASIYIANNTPAVSHAALADRDLPAQHPADAVFTDITNFDELLSVADTDVQLALDTIDAQACDKDAAEIITAEWKLNGGVIVNEGGADVDFRVEGDTDSNLLFADASTDRVGMGTGTPGYNLHLYRSGSNAILVVERDGGVQNYINATDAFGNFGVINDYPLRLVQNAQAKVYIDKDDGIHFAVTGAIGSPTDSDIDFSILANGDVGIANYNPSGRLDVVGNTGGFIFWDAATITGVLQTILPAGSVNMGMWFSFVVTQKTLGSPAGTSISASSLYPNNTAVLFTDGTNVCTLACTAGGAVTVQRTGGTENFELAIHIVYD